MKHEDYKELLAAKALTALDAEDAQALDSHLESCVECRTEIYEWEQTTAFIALDAGAFEPSHRVRELILASVRAEGASKTAIKARRSDERTGASAAAGVSRIMPFEQPRRNVWTSLGSSGAIAAALLFVGLLASLFILWQQNRSAQAELARLSSQVEERNNQISRQRTMFALLTSPGARMTHLAGTNSAPDAHGMLAYDKSGRAMLMARGLPAAPSGMAYQLWFIRDGKKMPGKVFTTDAFGNGSMEDQIPEFALGSATFSLTLEPARGVQAPTGATYLLGTS